MATQVQFRGGTTTEHASFNGVAREVTVDTTKQTLVVQDGSTNGGFPLLREKNPDGQKVYFGDGDDFQIWHQAADNRSYIWEGGSGALCIQGSYVKIQSPQTDPTDASEGEEDLAVFKSDGAAELYWGGASPGKKFETTQTGATITGTCTATTFIGALTGTASGNPTLAAGSDNRLITATGANALTGETALTFDGNALRVGGATHGSHSTFSDIFLGGAAHLYAETTGAAGNSLSISQNAHVDSDGSWEYIVTDEASNIYQYSGKIGFRTAASGTAGDDISWEERLLITATGEILIGRSAKPNDINKLVITGTSPADEYDSTLYLEGNETSGAANTGGALAFGGHDNTAFRNWGNIYGMKENGTGGNTASYMSFHTRADGGNPVERLRIDSTGHLYIKGQNHEVRWYRDDEARYGAVTYDGSNFNIKNPVNDHTRVCKSDGTEFVKFHNNGDILIADGDLVISTSGHGINFAATDDSSVGSTIAENLNDYENGRFTPKVYYGTGTDEPNYSWRYGYYIKVGRQVTVWFSLGITGFNPSPDVDEVYIANLPFQNDDPDSQWKYLNMLYDYSSASGWGFGSDDKQMFLALYDEKTKIRIVKNGGAHINTADVGSGQRWSSSFSYFTDS